jgi:hypothetical protein
MSHRLQAHFLSRLQVFEPESDVSALEFVWGEYQGGLGTPALLSHNPSVFFKPNANWCRSIPTILVLWALRLCTDQLPPPPALLHFHHSSGWLLGFFLGFLLLIWVWQDSVSTKQKAGIFVGVACNMAVTLLRHSTLTP